MGNVRGILLNMIRDKGLIDVWRNEHPDMRGFTRRQMAF